LATAVSCGGGDSGNTNGTHWSGTYNVPDKFGGFTGSVSFTVENNN
jgi:hypothetical protein